jgi:hypothetical protein
MSTFKTTLTIATAVALGATALASTSASAKFLPSTHLQPAGRTTPGVAGTLTFTPGVPGSFGNFAPSRPSGGSTPIPFCQLPTPSGSPRCG